MIEDLLAHHVGQRHFRRRDQPASVRRAEQVLGEFRQLAGAEHGVVAHEQRRRHLRIAVFAGVQVEHELPERPFQPRQLPGEHGEAGAGHAGGSLEIHLAERLADLVVLLCRDASRRACCPTLRTSRLALSSGPTGTSSSGMLGSEASRSLTVWSIAPGLLPGLAMALLSSATSRFSRSARPESLARHGLADLARGGIAPRLHVLKDLDLLAPPLIEFDEPLGGGRGAARLQRGVQRSGIFTYPFDVEHDGPRQVLLPWPARSSGLVLVAFIRPVRRSRRAVVGGVRAATGLFAGAGTARFIR